MTQMMPNLWIMIMLTSMFLMKTSMFNNSFNKMKKYKMKKKMKLTSW